MFLRTISNYSSTTGRVTSPFGVTIDAAGNFFVADSFDNHVQEYSSSGAFLGSIGQYGYGDGQFNTPYGVAVDAAGRLFVSDSTLDRVMVFTPAAVPEPASIALLGLGGVIVAAARRRSSRAGRRV